MISDCSQKLVVVVRKAVSVYPPDITCSSSEGAVDVFVYGYRHSYLCCRKNAKRRERYVHIYKNRAIGACWILVERIRHLVMRSIRRVIIYYRGCVHPIHIKDPHSSCAPRRIIRGNLFFKTWITG